MARIVGVDLPRDKKVEIGLTYIYGINRTSSNKILRLASVNSDARVKDLSEEEISRITAIIQRDYRVEGDLQREVSSNVKRLMDIGSYRGLRHRKGLPARGQRTSTNARTCKGPRKTVGVKRKESGKQSAKGGK